MLLANYFYQHIVKNSMKLGCLVTKIPAGYLCELLSAKMFVISKNITDICDIQFNLA